MVESVNGSVREEPVFVLALARTGSTLLRYILDSHDDIWCPPEVELVRVMQSLYHTYWTLYAADPRYRDQTKLEQRVYTEIGQRVDEMMRSFMRQGAKIWCDKSVVTVSDIPLVTKVFPRARYICLYRHCMDYVYSVMEATRYGWPAYFRDPFYRYVSPRPSSLVDAWANCWCDHSAKLLSFEKESFQSLPLKYESLVLEPEPTCRRLFAFIGVPFKPGMLDTVFAKSHQQGPGDIKIHFTRKIESTSIGRGYRLPVNKIEPATLERMNPLLGELSYEQVGPDWNMKVRPDPALYLDPQERRAVKQRLARIFAYANEKMKERDIHFVEKGRRVKVVMGDLENAAWLIDYENHLFEPVDKDADADTTVVLDTATLFKIVDRALNIGMALEDGLIHIKGNRNIAHYLSLIFI